MVKNLRKKLENCVLESKCMQAINKFLETKWYMIAFMSFVFLVQSFGLECVAFITIALIFAYVCFFMPDTNATIPLICGATFCISLMHSPIQGTSQYFSTPEFTVCLIIAIAVISLSILYRLIAYGEFKKVFTKSKLIWGIVALSIAYLLSGIGYKNYTFNDFIMSVIQAGSLFGAYLFLVSTADFKKFNLDVLASFCVVLLFYMIALIIFVYATNILGIVSDSGKWKNYVISGWGISNDLGTYTAMLIPSFFYKMFKAEKRSYIWYGFACLAMVAVFFTYCRSATLVGLIIMIACSIWAMCRKKNRKTAIITVISALIALVVLFIILYYAGVLEHVFAYHINKVNNGLEFDKISSGRGTIWKRYFNYFLEYPIFGGGFNVDMPAYNGYDPNNGIFSVYSFFAHNTVFQIMGSCGAVGLIAYIYHTITTIGIFLRKPTEKRFVFAVAIFGFVAMTMLDLMFFKTYFTLLYVVMLLVCEADLTNKENDNKIGE